MDISTANKGAFAIIRTELEFVIIVNERILGPYKNTDIETILKLYKAMQKA